jgi:hypothetical protein
MEHASVAAFARFSLDLLALGAPAELVALAAEALADETRHARLAFGLASTYGGGPVGPGLLALGAALAATSFEDIVVTAFREACIGETLAASEVAESASRATDPVAARLLSDVAVDESRHAAPGFRFVRWALETLPGSERASLEARLLEVLGQELSAASAPPATCLDAAETRLTAHGVLPEGVRLELRRRALAEVVAPCVRALLSRDAGRLAA